MTKKIIIAVIAIVAFAAAPRAVHAAQMDDAREVCSTGFFWDVLGGASPEGCYGSMDRYSARYFVRTK